MTTLLKSNSVTKATTFSKPAAADKNGPFIVSLDSPKATANLKSIGDAAAANTTLILKGASTDYTFKSAGASVTISTKAVGTTKAGVIASLDLTTVANGYNTPSVQFTDLTAKFHYVTAIKKTATSPAVPAYLELNSLLLSEDKGSSATDGISNSGKISLLSSTTKSTFSYSVDGGKTYTPITGTSVDLPAKDYEAGSVKIIEISAKKIINATTNAKAITVDKTAPAAPIIKLDSDTGISDKDSITQNGSVTLSGIEAGAQVSYSLDGTTFKPVINGNFIVPEGNYPAGKILVKQTDVAGNASATASLGALTVDTKADALSIALATDSGSSTTDGITNVATVNVTGLESGATWQYSVNGADFENGTGTSFNLPTDLTYSKGDILVRQTDIAGNESEVEDANTADWTLDTAAPAKLIDVDINDTGIDGDYITSLAKVTVNDLEAKATLYYNIDGSDKFIAATDNTFVVPNGSYAAGKIQWKQTDLAGNTSVLTSSSVKIVANDIVNVTAENPSVFDAGNANINFVVKAGNYTYNIANFGIDDKIDFPTGTPPTVINSNYTDNAVDLQYAANGNVTRLHLTNLTPAQDAAINSIASFNTQFGAKSVTSDGNIANTSFIHTTVSANGSASAAVGDNIFDFVAKTYSYSVSDFATGDALNFPVGTVATLINNDFADNKVDLQWAEGGNLVVVSVSGLTATQDASIIGVSSFKTLFGADSITNNGVPPILPANGSTITVSGNGNASASNGNLKFIFNPGNINYTISGFSAGDVLDFPDDGTATVINKSFTDSAIDVQWAANGNVIVVALTGLSSDSAVGLLSFNNAFGQGSII